MNLSNFFKAEFFEKILRCSVMFKDARINIMPHFGDLFRNSCRHNWSISMSVIVFMGLQCTKISCGESGKANVNKTLEIKIMIYVWINFTWKPMRSNGHLLWMLQYWDRTLPVVLKISLSFVCLHSKWKRLFLYQISLKVASVRCHSEA